MTAGQEEGAVRVGAGGGVARGWRRAASGQPALPSAPCPPTHRSCAHPSLRTAAARRGGAPAGACEQLAGPRLRPRVHRCGLQGKPRSQKTTPRLHRPAPLRSLTGRAVPEPAALGPGEATMAAPPESRNRETTTTSERLTGAPSSCLRSWFCSAERMSHTTTSTCGGDAAGRRGGGAGQGSLLGVLRVCCAAGRAAEPQADASAAPARRPPARRLEIQPAALLAPAPCCWSPRRQFRRRC